MSALNQSRIGHLMPYVLLYACWRGLLLRTQLNALVKSNQPSRKPFPSTVEPQTMSNHSQNPKPLRLLTPQETAAFLSVSVSTVQRLVSAGDLHAVRIRKSMRFRMDDLLHFIDRNDWS